MSTFIRVDNKGRITIPWEIRNAARIEKNEYLVIKIDKSGCILLKKAKSSFGKRYSKNIWVI